MTMLEGRKLMRLLTMALVLGLVGFTTPGWAVDVDNDGAQGGILSEPGEYDGQLVYGASLVTFPVASDNFSVASFPHWWHAGDTGWGDRAIAESQVTEATISLMLDRNGQTCDSDEFDFSINDIVVGHFAIPAGSSGDLGPFVFHFGPFAPVPAVGGMYTLRYTVTETVLGGCGSVELSLDGDSTVDLSGGPTATEATTWGTIKSLYR